MFGGRQINARLIQNNDRCTTRRPFIFTLLMSRDLKSCCRRRVYGLDANCSLSSVRAGLQDDVVYRGIRNYFHIMKRIRDSCWLTQTFSSMLHKKSEAHLRAIFHIVCQYRTAF